MKQFMPTEMKNGGLVSGDVASRINTIPLYPIEENEYLTGLVGTCAISYLNRREKFNTMGIDNNHE